MPLFARYIGIDYSGAETATSSLKSLQICIATREATPELVSPPVGPKKYWTRRGVAEWLVERLQEKVPTLIGIDHGFSFPIQYFEKYGLNLDWPTFLHDFQYHWPTDEDHVYVDFVRYGSCGNGAARCGDSRWRRLTEKRMQRAKSLFHFDVQGQVAKSTHSGIPWLRYIRNRMGEGCHFWPFDGWDIPIERSVVAEVYPSLWNHKFSNQTRSVHEHDAWSVAEWMRLSDLDGSLTGFFKPKLTEAERPVAEIEGWILGIP